ncbi:MAG TPA: hypothetical protein DDW52_01815 [Planctomycetaceae bacterium]|nr:hypothetical protein [Planctomycetaceae bacterium]
MEAWLTDWRIDSLDNSGKRCLCSPAQSSERFTHFGKLFRGSTRHPSYESFCRSATLSLQINAAEIPSPIGGRLESGSPILVYERLSAIRLDEWLTLDAAPQPIFRRVAVATQLIAAVGKIHQAGYVHNALTSEHILLLPDDSLRLVGWGSCEVVGEVAASEEGLAARRPGEAKMSSGGFVRQNRHEACTSRDIESLAYVLAQLLGNAFLESRLAEGLLCDNTEHRLTSAELHRVLTAFQAQLHTGGWTRAA